MKRNWKTGGVIALATIMFAASCAVPRPPRPPKPPRHHHGRPPTPPAPPRPPHGPMEEATHTDITIAYPHR